MPGAFHRASPPGGHEADGPRQNSPGTGVPSAYPRKSSPNKPKYTNFGVFSARWANFFAHTHTSGSAGRTNSRTGRSHVATLKPTTPLPPLTQARMKPPSPLLAPKQQPLKPMTPLQPKNTPKTPISYPQRRRRFQPTHLTSPQRRRRFHLRLSLREQRLRWFQITGPPGLRTQTRCPWAAAGPGIGTYGQRRGLAGRPAAGGRPALQTSSNHRELNRPATASVTYVVNLSQKTAIFGEKALGLTTFVTTRQKSTRKTPPIDDVCNNTHRSIPIPQHARLP